MYLNSPERGVCECDDSSDWGLIGVVTGEPEQVPCSAETRPAGLCGLETKGGETFPWEVHSSERVQGMPTRDESLKVRVMIK